MSRQTPEGKGFDVHPARFQILAEVHARPFSQIDTPRRLLHFGFMTDHWAADRDRAALEAFCLARGRPTPSPEAKYHRIDVPPALLRWEYHGEFTTYTWEFPSQARPGEAESLTPFRPGPDELAHFMRLLPQPGPLLVAADLHLLPERAVGDGYRHLFGETQLAAADVENGAARVATDFHPDAFGFVRILILDRKLTQTQAGALAQTLLEIETYRSLVLLGLPQAQAIAPTVRRIETELPLLMNKMRESPHDEANEPLLDRLISLAADLETEAAPSLFRFGATRAYHDLLAQRLEWLSERAIGGSPTLSSCLSRRLTPAMRSSAAMETRQANLSDRLTHTAQLLRTRVEVARDGAAEGLLQGLANHTVRQDRLLHLVEILALVALTYLVTAMARMVFEAIHIAFAWFDPVTATALVLPFAFFIVTLGLRRLRKRSANP